VKEDALRSLDTTTSKIALLLRGGSAVPTDAAISAYLKSNVSDDYAASVQLANGTVLGKPPPGGIGALPPVLRTPVGPGRGSPGDHDPFGPPHTDTVSYHSGEVAQLIVPDPDQNGFYVIRVYASTATLHSGETG